MLGGEIDVLGVVSVLSSRHDERVNFILQGSF